MASKKNSVRTGKSVASAAGKVLASGSGKAAKSIAASALTNRKSRSK